MIQIVMKPDYSIKPKNGENCYIVMFNGENVGFRVLGRKASHAEEKLMVIFREQLKGKLVAYNLEAYNEIKGESAVAEERKTDEDLEPMLPGMEDAR